jgi:redox-sensitive bicupin YhaK (pirin superfamily)
VNIRRAADRGHARLSWLDSWHTFSFADYHDPEHVQFGHLRVINDDRIAGGGGFGTHPHRDMEILTYMLDGALQHRDSMGNGSVIRPGEVQRMTAGTGVTHSEFNHSSDETAHLLQIWILPDRAGHAPGYEQKEFPEAEKRGRLRLVASKDGRDGSLTINQDVDVYAALLNGDEQIRHELAPGRQCWLQVARGALELNGEQLQEGDGASFTDAPSLELGQGRDAEILLFEMSAAA